MDPPRPGLLDRLLRLIGVRLNPTRHWPESHEPLPVFDLSTGSLGTLRFEDTIDSAEFLGRPNRVENPGWTKLYYLAKGFELHFEGGQFTKLTCAVAPSPDGSPELGQEYSRPRLSNGIQLTPETTEPQVRQWFGEPESDENEEPLRILYYVRGRYYMAFDFDLATGKLVTWSASLDD